jgi:hypothetical protein
VGSTALHQQHAEITPILAQRQSNSIVNAKRGYLGRWGGPRRWEPRANTRLEGRSHGCVGCHDVRDRLGARHDRRHVRNGRRWWRPVPLLERRRVRIGFVFLHDGLFLGRAGPGRRLARRGGPRACGWGRWPAAAGSRRLLLGRGGLAWLARKDGHATARAVRRDPRPRLAFLEAEHVPATGLENIAVHLEKPFQICWAEHRAHSQSFSLTIRPNPQLLGRGLCLKRLQYKPVNRAKRNLQSPNLYIVPSCHCCC